VPCQLVAGVYRQERACLSRAAYSSVGKGHSAPAKKLRSRFTVQSIRDCPLQKGEVCYLKNVGFTKSTAVTLNIISWWGTGYVEPIFLITNMDNPYAAGRYYRQRFQIETFFSDQKSRGLHIHKSHLADPARLSRLLIAVCLAYI
jgi:hypothetical protein